MRVTVTVKKGSKFNRREAGKLVTYDHNSKPFTVSQHVYENFRNRLNVVGTPPPPAVAPIGRTPGTDDEPEAPVAPPAAAPEAEASLETGTTEERPDDAEPGDQASGTTTDGQQLEPVQDPQVSASEGDDPPPPPPIVAELARVGIVVRPEAAAAWTDQEAARAWAVVDRKGKGNLPAFIKAAAAPTE